MLRKVNQLVGRQRERERQRSLEARAAGELERLEREQRERLTAIINSIPKARARSHASAARE